MDPAKNEDPRLIRRVLLALAAERGPGATFCPSEAALRLGGEWRGRMPAVRAAAAELAAKGALACTQRGFPADPLRTRGPVRLGAPGSRGGPPETRVGEL
ncbi:MAG: DUF3253 domain-containing protein [Opitutaceae bacterium]